jgi:hypothetical protein
MMFSLMLGSDPVNTIIHFCIILSLAAQNINSGTIRGLIAAIPVVGLLILRDPFAVALQMVQELKPQFVSLSRQQRELLDFLIYRLASRMKSSTDMSDAFGSCVRFCYFFRMHFSFR